jgi:hypothetical protein
VGCSPLQDASIKPLCREREFIVYYSLVQGLFAKTKVFMALRIIY